MHPRQPAGRQRHLPQPYAPALRVPQFFVLGLQSPPDGHSEGGVVGFFTAVVSCRCRCCCASPSPDGCSFSANLAANSSCWTLEAALVESAAPCSFRTTRGTGATGCSCDAFSATRGFFEAGGGSSMAFVHRKIASTVADRTKSRSLISMLFQECYGHGVAAFRVWGRQRVGDLPSPTTCTTSRSARRLHARGTWTSQPTGKSDQGRATFAPGLRAAAGAAADARGRPYLPVRDFHIFRL